MSFQWSEIHRISAVTIVVISRLAYRKGIDLLVAAAPRICEAFPNVRFVVGMTNCYFRSALSDFIA